MSGFRRHLMAEVANRSYIEGYCNVYNSTYTFHLYLNGKNSGNIQQITVNTDANGYWRYKLGLNKLYRLQEAFTSVSQAESSKLVSVNFHCDMSYLDSIYCMCYNTNSVHVENLTSITGIKFSESNYLTGYRYGFRGTQVSQISLEGWKNSNAQNAQGMFYACRLLTTIKTDATTSIMISNANVMFRYCNSLENLDLSFSWVEFSQNVNLSYAFGETYSLKSNPQDGIFDLSRFTFGGNLSNMFFTFANEKTTWESQTGKTAWGSFTHIALPTILDGCDVTNAFLYLTYLEEITACGNIGAIIGDLSFVNAQSLSLNSAKLVLSKLQDLQGVSATLTFSSSTIALIYNDATAMSLIDQAFDYGWNVTGFQSVSGQCNVYNDTYTFNPYINDTRIAITVNTDANGYWRHTLAQNENITSLNQAFIFVSQAESDKLTSIKFNVDNTITSLQRAFGYLNDNFGCTNLVRIDGIKCNATDTSAYENSFSMCSSLTFVDVSQLQSTSLQSVSTVRMFNNCRSLVTIDGLSTFFQNNKLYRATGMFADCRSLSSIDTTYLDMQYCEYAYNMFLNCHALTSLDVSAFNLSNCTRIDKMFQSCINLTSIDITNWNVSLVTDATNLIYGCSSLTSIGDVSGWDTHSMTKMYRMFADAPALISDANNTLDCSSWDTSALTVATQPNQANGFRQFFGGSVSVTHLGIPTIKEGVTVANMFNNLTNLTTITACGNIYAPYDTLSFSNCPLDLNSAKLILSKLQNTNGNSATITFSSTTSALVQASINNGDAATISAVTNAIDNGWTITDLNMIYGQAIQVDGAYPAVVSLRINNVLTIIHVNPANGYFYWAGTITSLRNCISDNLDVDKIKVRTSSSVDMYQFARRASNITEIDCRGITANDLYFAFGLNGPDYNRGERMKLHTLVLPLVTSNTSNSQYSVNNTTVLTNVDATTLENSVNFTYSPLTLQSAINILSALQDVTSYGGATLTFSSTTKGYINNDQDALALVANAVNNLGWTIALT